MMPERHGAFERDRFLLDTLAERRQHGDARRPLLAERVTALHAILGAGTGGVRRRIMRRMRSERNRTKRL